LKHKNKIKKFKLILIVERFILIDIKNMQGRELGGITE
jgi:hypothetical protein